MNKILFQKSKEGMDYLQKIYEVATEVFEAKIKLSLHSQKILFLPNFLGHIACYKPLSLQKETSLMIRSQEVLYYLV